MEFSFSHERTSIHSFLSGPLQNIRFVLDEPTSTYDAEAEYELYKNYEKLLVDKTSIFISHRLSSCILSDYIILLDNGEVIEEGTHKELMERETQYKCMFELQATQYNSRKGKCYE